ncbi:hypothetical protein K7X08_023051 [Anisodus acutangulus]|uniref:Uncharacterized protein n=1 Tax=Anisodus acutangulus TaxID=402998 RepID=A0A9Q1RH02_9SOLA|nr:hypothetical protein K7X08_023051 [Anisodus acutangulus]
MICLKVGKIQSGTEPASSNHLISSSTNVNLSFFKKVALLVKFPCIPFTNQMQVFLCFANSVASTSRGFSGSELLLGHGLMHGLQLYAG